MSTQEIAGSVITTIPHIDTSILGMLSASDLVSKIIVLILLMASAWSWLIVVSKFSLYSTIKKSVAAFEKLFWSGQVLDSLHERVKKSENDPLAAIFIAAMNEFKKNKEKGVLADSVLKVGVKDRLMQVMNLEYSREVEKIEDRLGFLAMVASSATFVGLFGTVWGIMSSFQSIGASQNTSLAVVAPGIAEALLLTAIGLFAAIPAAAFYSVLVGNAAQIINRMDDFISELHTILSRSVDEGRM